MQFYNSIFEPLVHFYFLDLSSCLCVRSIQVHIHQFHCVFEVSILFFNSIIGFLCFVVFVLTEIAYEN